MLHNVQMIGIKRIKEIKVLKIFSKSKINQELQTLILELTSTQKLD